MVGREKWTDHLSDIFDVSVVSKIYTCVGCIIVLYKIRPGESLD